MSSGIEQAFLRTQQLSVGSSGLRGWHLPPAEVVQRGTGSWGRTSLSRALILCSKADVQTFLYGHPEGRGCQLFPRGLMCPIFCVLEDRGGPQEPVWPVLPGYCCVSCLHGLLSPTNSSSRRLQGIRGKSVQILPSVLAQKSRPILPGTSGSPLLLMISSWLSERGKLTC